MSYEGRYTYSLDHKGRLFIPAKFRKRLPPEADGILVVTKGFDGCLSLYPLDEWNDRFEKWLRSLPVNRTRARRVVRWFMGNAERVPVDGQGRIKIPQHLLEHARIEGEAIIVGNLERLEVWNPKLYEDLEKKTEKNLEKDLEALDFDNREDRL